MVGARDSEAGRSRSREAVWIGVSKVLGLSQKQCEPLKIFRQRRDLKYLDFYKITLAAVWKRG